MTTIESLRAAGVRRVTLNLFVDDEGAPVWSCYLAANHVGKRDKGVAVEFTGASPDEALEAALGRIAKRREDRTGELEAIAASAAARSERGRAP